MIGGRTCEHTQPCKSETFFEDDLLGDCGIYHATFFPPSYQYDKPAGHRNHISRELRTDRSTCRYDSGCYAQPLFEIRSKDQDATSERHAHADAGEDALHEQQDAETSTPARRQDGNEH